MTEDEGRAALVAEALTWVGTPYHHEGRLKGIGTDCGMMLAEIGERAGVIPRVEVERYAPDRHLHFSSEDYLNVVLRYCRETQVAKPGDVALWQFGKSRSHGAIVLDWPKVIHATVRERKVWVCDTSQYSQYATRKPLFYSLW